LASHPSMPTIGLMRSGSLLVLLLAVLLGAAAPAWAHPEPNDIDGDNVLNERDNCVSVYNFDQADADADGAGNKCDADFDGDGDGARPEYRFPGGPPADNCPGIPNADQLDTDGDQVGDACDFDTDLDETADVFDNCPTVHNFGQGDNDNDQVGDACDDDIDADLLLNGPDNCDAVYNPDQRDADGDGRGFLCDADDTPPLAPGGGGGGGDPSDRTKPAVRASRARTYRSADLRGGLPVAVRCSEACAITARLKAGRRTLARGTATLGAAGRTYVFLRANRRTVRWIARRGRVRASLRLVAADRSGNERSVRRPVTVRG
jgi:hypothetical protein